MPQEMRDIWLLGTAVTAAVVVSWSMATFAKPPMASEADAAEAWVTILPLEMKAREHRNLRLEYWADRF
jgi:hypothetical protein